MNQDNTINSKIETSIQGKFKEFKEIQDRLKRFREFANTEPKVIIVGPPRSGKSTFIQRIREDPSLGDLMIEERTFGFKVKEEGTSEIIEAYTKKDFIKIAQILIDKNKKKGSHPRSENVNIENVVKFFKFWITEEELNIGLRPFEWNIENGEKIKYHLPGLLIKGTNDDEWKRKSEDQRKEYYEKQREMYDKLIDGFGIGRSTSIEDMKDVIIRLIEVFARILPDVTIIVVATYLVLSIVRGKGEKKVSRELFSLAVIWEDLNDEVKELFAARLAVEMGMGTEEGVKKVLEALNSLFGTYRDKLEITLDEVENRIKKIDGLYQENEESINQYYNVNETPVEVKRSEINELLNEFSNWRKYKLSEISNIETNPLFYVVVGPSGIGKSWFSYIVVSKLMRQEAVKAEGKFVIYSIRDPKSFEYPSPKSGKCLLILDEDRLTTSILQENLASVLVKAFNEDNVECPILITMEETLWRSVLEKAERSLVDRGKLDLWRKLKDQGNLFKEIRIEMSETELLETLESMLSSKKIEVSDELLKKEIVKRARLPIILRYFLEGKEEVRKDNLKEIGQDPTIYAFRKIRQFYFRNGNILVETDEGKEEFLRVLALLGAMLESEEIPMGALDKEMLSFLGLTKENSLLYSALDSLISLQKGTVGVMESENGKVKVFFPLFKMDYRGMLSPIHDSVKGAYEILVTYLKEKSVLPELKDDNLIKKLERKYFNIDEFSSKYLNRIENELVTIYDGYRRLIDQIYKDAENYIKRYQSYFSTSSNVSIFLFDIISVALYLNDEDFRSKTFEVIAYILERNSNKVDIIQIIENMMRLIAKLIDEIHLGSLLRLSRKSPYKLYLHDLILRMLSINNEYARSYAWRIIGDFIGGGLLKPDEVRKKKHSFISLLESSDKRVRFFGWENVLDLIEKGVLTREDSKMFLELLESLDYYARLDAWAHVDVLIDKAVLTVNEVRQKKNYFLEFLKSFNDDIRLNAWEHVRGLIDKNILTWEDSKVFLKLLESQEDYVRFYAWDNIAILIEKGIITLEVFFKLLESPNEYVCLYAWESITDLIGKGLVTRKDSKVFFKLLESRDGNVRTHAWENVDILIEKGIVTREDSKVFLKMLESSDLLDRLYTWGHVNDLIDSGILTLDEVRQEKSYLLELLKSLDVALDYWDGILYLIDKGVVTQEEIREHGLKGT